MNALEIYLRELRDIRASGEAVAETSYYPALADLLNDVGKGLMPKVRCIINIKNRGAGLPDGGLFTSDQFQKATAAQPTRGQIPARGAIEVKGTSDDAWTTAESKQVSRYLRTYRQVLVTNLRDFVLVGQDADGQPVKLETYSLAESEADFWAAARTPRKMADAHGGRCLEFLKRAILQAAPLTAHDEVAWLLASYAREARERIERTELPALNDVRDALEEALGLKFEGEKGEHFFRSTLVQTLFYGIFSAWVLWSKHQSPTKRNIFNWHEAIWFLRVPMIKALFARLATPARLEPLGLVEVLDWTAAALNRVDRAMFFANFDEAQAVQYFYEPFLQSFDPKLAKELGVWYTPPEVVKYMVARVDEVLREELGLADGLADPNVYVLDPCCGTGAYLVEVLKRIAETLRAKGGDALLGDDILRVATERVFGFEILPAPFVISHLQIGLFLESLGVRLTTDSSERIGVFLTNALSGWELRDQPPLDWPELEAERTGSGSVKQQKPILVVIGNPPYNAFGGVSPLEEEGLVEEYKGVYFIQKPVRKKSKRQPTPTRRYRLSDSVAQGGWGIKKFNLDDLYVRFFRVAERRIAEKTGKGIVCYISNFSYLNDPSFVIMRQRFLAEFHEMWFDCMNGDSRETGKLTPEGNPDPSVFSTESNRAGIRLGTAIGLLLRRGPKDDAESSVHFRDFWGVTKRKDLLASLQVKDFDDQYQSSTPNESNRYSFRPINVPPEYLAWPQLVELCSEPPINGLQEMRKGALMHLNRPALEERMRAYFDPSVDWNTLRHLASGLTRDAGRFDAVAARKRLQDIDAFDPAGIVRYALYPLDFRWCYHSNVRPLWNEPRPALASQVWEGNTFLVTRMMAERPREQIPIYATSSLLDYHLLRPNAVAIPIRLRSTRPPADVRQAEADLGAFDEALRANLSAQARAYLASLQVGNVDTDEETAALIWMHALAIGFSSTYLAENGEGIRQDWPRIPIPASKDSLLASAALGRQIAVLLDIDAPAEETTTGTVRHELRPMAVISRVGGGELNPAAGDLALTVGWGHAGRDGVTMPGRGKVVERAFASEERAAIKEGARALGLNENEALVRIGETTYDLYLNEKAYWRNVPVKIWEYTIGGYQVIKKWLSYREEALLGRALSSEEARQVTDMVRRIAVLRLMEPTLDRNYEAIKAATFEWKRTTPQRVEGG